MSKETTWEMITTRIKALKDLYDRMDNTKELIYMDPEFELTNFKGEKIERAVHITGNKPATFVNVIRSNLMEAKWQTIIEGDISSRQAKLIEDFINDNLDEADEMLNDTQDISSLHDWNSNHVCTRSIIGVRWLGLVKDGKYVIDCRPMDMRWTPYRRGGKHLKWVAPISFLSKEDIREEFEEVLTKEEYALITFKEETKDNELRDYWNSEKNEIWINNKLIKTQNHNLKRPPFVIAFPPSGFMLRDKGYMKHEAEDVLFLNRNLYKELNRSLSVEQTLGFTTVFPAYEKEVVNKTAEPSEPPPVSGESLDVKPGERHEPVPLGDLNNASLAARTDIQEMLGEGAPVAPRIYTQPPSGAELALELEVLARQQNPRIKALQSFRVQLARLMIDQYSITAKDETDLSIGRQGRKRKYTASKMVNPDRYSISYILLPKNTRAELANLVMFQGAAGELPLRMRLRDILHAEDPDGIMRDLDIEEAKKADPSIALFEQGVRYAEEAEDIEDEHDKDLKNMESMLLISRGVAIVKQRLNPMIPPEETEVPKGGEEVTRPGSLLPLLGGTGLPARGV